MLPTTALLAILSALAITTTHAAPLPQDPSSAPELTKRYTTNSLAYYARQKSRYLGNVIQSYQLTNTQYSGIVEGQFGAITPENEMKWEVIQPTEGNFDFSGTDKVRHSGNITFSITLSADCSLASRSSLKRKRRDPSSGGIISAGTNRDHLEAPSPTDRITDTAGCF